MQRCVEHSAGRRALHAGFLLEVCESPQFREACFGLASLGLHPTQQKTLVSSIQSMGSYHIAIIAAIQFSSQYWYESLLISTISLVQLLAFVLHNKPIEPQRYV